MLGSISTDPLDFIHLIVGMDPLDFIPVRFHFGGEFLNDGKTVHYIGGNEAMSYIERDKMSLPELSGHLKDHFDPSDPVLLHWLFPRKDLTDGLRILVDDSSCFQICQCITDGGVADVFVELVIVDVDQLEEDKDGQCSDWEAEASVEQQQDSSSDEANEENSQALTIISSPEQVQKNRLAVRKYKNWLRGEQEEVPVPTEAPVSAPMPADSISGT